jgi:hypothetical protein
MMLPASAGSPSLRCLLLKKNNLKMPLELFQLFRAHSTVVPTPAVIDLFKNAGFLIAFRLGFPCLTRTSTCRNFETVSSGFSQLYAICGPPFPKHGGGPV